jgi:putative Ca2+/H+ antiporter (TMEM165/GDT1 family)
MNGAEWAVILSVGVFAGMIVCLELGFRIGRSSAEKSPQLAHEGIGTIEAAVFALLGLLLASASRAQPRALMCGGR